MSSDLIDNELIQAAKRGNINEVKRLISKGADVNAETEDNLKWTALHYATQFKYKDVIALLLEKGADVNAKDSSGFTPLHFATIGTIDTQIIHDLLYKIADINAVNKNGDTPLHLAARNEQKSADTALSILLKGFKPDINARGRGGNTPLSLAIEHGKAEVVLCWAAEYGRVEVVKELLKAEGIDVNASKYGITPLDKAAKNYHLEVIGILLSNGADPAKLVDLYKWTPLHLAVAKSDVQGILNEQANANSVESKNNWTPLHLALKKDKVDIDVLNALLGKEEIDVNLADKNGDTPLFLVLKKDNIDINVLNALLEAKDINVNLMDSDKDAPLHSFLKWFTFKSNEINIDVLNALLRKEGIDVNARDKYGETPLHWILRPNKINIKIVEALIKAGADVNTQDKDGKTPLHFAAQFNREKEVVEVLLTAKKVDINIVDEDGKTPLDLTTNKEIKALLKKAAEDPDAGSVDEPLMDSEGVQEGDAQTEEQPSSFFGSLFSILMKPFSLIGSFFGGFFSWLFGSDEPTQSLPESDQPVVLEPPSNSGDNDII